jgi:chromosomal replication initiation ATPase DnaA
MNTQQPALSSTQLLAPQGRRLLGSVHEIMREIAAAHNVSVDELLADDRRPNIVMARHEWFYRCLTETTKTMRVIARLANHHHSTVISGARTHEKRLIEHQHKMPQQ